MTPARKSLFAALTTLLAFTLVEGGLQILAAARGQGWRVDPLPGHEDYQVLCEYGALLRLCPDQGPAYERVRPLVFARQKDRPRVVAIGESFVYGLGLPAGQAFPARLQELLGDQAEVLNLGRCGTYASRLVPLVQAAITLEADVVVLAVGNNEHTMTSFYAGWAGRHPLAVYTASEALGRLQLYGLLARSIGIPPRVEESFDAVPATFGDRRDQQIYAVRRRPPDLSSFRRPELPPQLALADRQVTAALEQEKRLKERIFQRHLEGMVRALHDRGIAVVQATLPQDLTSAPVLSGVHDGDEAQVIAMLQRLGDRPSPDPALVAQAVALDPRLALFSYLDGVQRLGAQGADDPAAVAALWQAVEWDLVPDATPSLNRIVAQVAAEEGAALVDLAALSGPWAADTRAHLLDDVHLSEAGAREVARALAPAVEQALAGRRSATAAAR